MTVDEAGAVRGERRGQIADALRSLDERIAAACAAAGRARDDVTTIVITKTYPARDVDILAEIGVRDVGENRIDEAADKHAELADVAARLTWHQVGQVQTNKVAALARWVDVVHSVDRGRLIDSLDRAAATRGRPISALVQVSLDGDPRRGGAIATEVPRLADRIASSSHLRLAGVMAVAPLGSEPDRAFAALADVSQAVQARHPQATMISAGMSGDLEQAIAHGATHLRVGTAVLGSRRIRQ